MQRYNKMREIQNKRVYFYHSSFRTPSRHTAVVKWGRTPLAEDILISSVRGGGAELGRCEARNDADATDAKFKGVCILRRYCGT